MTGVFYSPDWAAALEAALGPGTQRAHAQRLGLSQATIHGYLSQGRIPPRKSVAALADRLGLAGEQRTQFFHAAGYMPERAAR